MVKKRVGAKEQHKATVVAVSGARTKKHQRKVARRQRLAAEEQALEAAMDLEEVAPTEKNKRQAKASAPEAAPMQE